MGTVDRACILPRAAAVVAHLVGALWQRNPAGFFRPSSIGLARPQYLAPAVGTRTRGRGPYLQTRTRAAPRFGRAGARRARKGHRGAAKGGNRAPPRRVTAGRARQE